MEDNSTRELAYNKLRRLLTTSALQPGTRLTEIEWAERLGVHRGAAREAMAILLHEGLLSRNGRSFVVPVFDDREIQEIYQARAVLEVAALRMCVGRELDEAILQELAELCDAMEHLLKAELFLGYSEADAKFHGLLMELSGNQRLVKVYRSAPLPHVKYGGILPEDIGKVLNKAQREHAEICRCVEGRRIDAAIEVLQEHLNAGSWWLTDEPSLGGLRDLAAGPPNVDRG